jgi:hypothetical protein
MSHSRSSKLKTLERRLGFLLKRDVVNGENGSYDRAEADALKWAIGELRKSDKNHFTDTSKMVVDNYKEISELSVETISIGARAEIVLDFLTHIKEKGTTPSFKNELHNAVIWGLFREIIEGEIATQQAQMKNRILDIPTMYEVEITSTTNNTIDKRLFTRTAEEFRNDLLNTLEDK